MTTREGVILPAFLLSVGVLCFVDLCVPALTIVRKPDDDVAGS
jgi:hypothetical protein